MSSTLLALGIEIGIAAAKGIASAIANKKLVEQLVAENREPTDAEWEKLNASMASLHTAIQQA